MSPSGPLLTVSSAAVLMLPATVSLASAATSRLCWLLLRWPLLLLPAAMVQGVPYYMSATQFDAGEYLNANNFQVRAWSRLWSAAFRLFNAT
jgi:hypothetical protein